MSDNKASQAIWLEESGTQTLLNEHVEARDDGLHAILPQLYSRALEVLLLNDALSACGQTFARKGEQDAFEGASKSSGPRELFTLSDALRCKGKACFAAQWGPGRNDLVAVCCTDKGTSLSRPPESDALLFWDLKEQSHPVATLLSFSGILCFDINPLQPELVIAGCSDGSLALWDQGDFSADLEPSNGAKKAIWPSSKSALSSNHGVGVAAVRWLPGVSLQAGKLILVEKQCSVFLSLAPDGKIVFWDTAAVTPRKKSIKEVPNEAGKELKHSFAVRLDTEGSILNALSLHIEIGSTGINILLGCSDGRFISLSKNALQSPRGQDSETCFVINQLHCGAICYIAASPFLERCYLLIGDWTFSIFDMNEPSKPYLVSPAASSPYVSGSWSPNRPGVLILVRQDGVLEVWDLVDATHQPTITETIAPCALTCLVCAPLPITKSTGTPPTLMAIGDDAGVLHIMDLPRRLRKPSHNEQENVLKILRP